MHGSFWTAAKALAACALAGAALVVAAPAGAVAPFDGTTVSPGLGPTFGDPWCANAAAGSSIANQQGAPLALIPYEAFGCTLDKFQTEANAAGLPVRMSSSIIGQSAGGRNQYGVVVNALETPNQIRDYQRWQQVRAIELTDPVNAQILLDSWNGDVKMPIFIEANIHGDEEEGADAIMQAIRDLVTTPMGVNPTVDKILDHTILIVIPSQNPDGRFIGQRANANNFDLNRDFLVQSQSEVRNNIKLQQQWLATAGLAMHGYVNPTLIDGLTKPHNPGLEYDLFLKWNQRRLDADQAALAAVGMGITRPNAANGVTGYTAYCSAGASVTAGSSCGASTQRTIAAAPGGATEVGNTVTITTTAALSLDLTPGARVTISGVANTAYNGTYTILASPTTTSFTYVHPTQSDLPASGGGTAAPLPSPANAEGWDDWGPFYTQTYMAFYGPDSSTLEMCSSGTGCNGRFGSKRAQYVGFYASANFWIDNRAAMMHDQVEMFRRGVTSAPRPLCCTDPLVALRGFNEDQHNWMVPYPTAFVIPVGANQRSNGEANRMTKWLLDNGIVVRKATADFTWNGKTYEAGSYVVFMNQALRGLALTTLDPGQDISARITQLYAPPGAWSHGQLWGADTVEVPAGDASFAPATTPITAVSTLPGGVRGGVGAPSDFYSVSMRGMADYRILIGLLKSGVPGEVAEAPFTSTTGGPMPAGSLIFPASAGPALDAAGAGTGLWFERNVGVTKPATTQLARAPRVAVLVNSANPAASDTTETLEAIFGADQSFLSVTTGATSIQNAPTDPLLNYDVIVNTGQGFPGTGSTIAATGATESGNTVTITTTAAHNLQPGAVVTIAGVGVAGYNGTFSVVTVPTTTTFTVTNPAAGLAASGGGTVTTQTRARLNSFFARGGGYVATGQSTTNYSFLTGAVPALVNGSFTQTSSSAGGGITAWDNVGGAASPITGGYPATDFLFMPGNVTYYTAIPTGAVVDGRNNPNMVGTAPNGPSPGFVAGLWRNRAATSNGAAVVIHGNTTAGSRYSALATNPLSRQDAEREWPILAQTALWSALDDEATSAITFPAASTFYNAAGFQGGCSGAICGTASGGAGPAIAKVQVAVQRSSTGLWWDGIGFTAASPVYADAVGTATWSFAFPAASFPADGAYVVRSKSTAIGGSEQVNPASLTFSIDNTAPTSAITFPANGSFHDANTWNPGCTSPAGDVCGTSADAGSGPASVTWSLRQVSTGMYWGGSAFNAVAPMFLPATGSATWSAPFAFGSFPADGSYTLTAKAKDTAGNEEAGSTSTFTVDTTAPTSAATLSGTVNLNWWRNPTVTITATDPGGSGVQKIEYRLDGGAFQTYTAAFVVTGDGSHTVDYRATDNLGHVEATKTLTFLVDGNAPTTTAVLTPAPQGGFYRTPLVTLISLDGLGSGVAAIQYTVDGGGTQSYDGPFHVTGDGSHTITFRGVDLTGLVETTKTMTFSVDSSAPQTTATLSPAAGLDGFYGSPTSVTLSGNDFGGSGVASIEFLLDSGSWTPYAGSVPVTGEGSHTIQFHGTDLAGNVESVKTKSFTIDTVGPMITITTPGGGADYVLFQSVTPAFTCTDAVSGVAGCNGPGVVSTGTVGPHTFTVTATDNAGNTSTLVRSYNVHWPFSWITAAGSRFNAGKDAKVQFSLGGDRGTGVLAAGSPTSQQVDCTTGVPIGAASPSGGALSHSGGTYTFTWTTVSAWKNSCRDITFDLTDATEHTLRVEFR